MFDSYCPVPCHRAFAVFVSELELVLDPSTAVRTMGRFRLSFKLFA